MDMDSVIPAPAHGGAHLSLGKSIAIAETVSSAASLGAVWLVGRHPQMIAPAKQFVAEHVLYPIMSKQLTASSTQEEKDSLMKKAVDRASLFLKGIVMVSASFATHIPTQMALEGKCDLKEFKKVVLGKSIGLTAATGALALVNVMKPGVIGKVEDTIADTLSHCTNTTSQDECAANKELCKLMLIDIPSSLFAGLVNYQLTKRL